MNVIRQQRRSILVHVAVGAAMLAFVVACGSGDGSGSEVSNGGGAPEPAWAGRVLEGEHGPDQPTRIGVDGEKVVVMLASDEGVITGFASDEQGGFLAGESLTTGVQYLSLGGITRFGDRWVALGSGGLLDGEKLLFDVRAFGSADGRTWSEVEATGFDGPADVTGLTTVADGVVAVGTLRAADQPARGGFRPVAWHSADGATWTTVPLPTDGGVEGTAQGLAVVGDEVIAVGNIDRKGTMWSSTDHGESWTIVEREGIPSTSSLSSIARQDGVLVASGTTAAPAEGGDESAQLLMRSTDGGRRWSKVTDPPPPNRGEGFAFPLFSGGGRFFTLGYSFIQAGVEPEVCYADIDLCLQDLAVALYVSDDGDHWRRVDTSGIGEGEAGEVDGITATDEGRIVALSRVAEGVATWTWPAGTPLPTGREPVDPSTEVDVLGENDTPEPGRRYGVRLYIHCGMDWLYVGGEAWKRTDDGPDIETGAGDRISNDWPVAQETIFGFATLVRDDLIEYSIGNGEVIATYAPADEPPPGCR